jgi:hypothetical protein
MALLIDTLVENKNIFNPSADLNAAKYGIWDLTRSSVTFNGVSPELKSVVVVSEYFQMRPDLMAVLNMGDQGKMGTLLKFNGISNPFAIKEGLLLAIPTTSTTDDMIRAKKLMNQKAPNSNTNTNPNQTFRKNQEQKKFEVSPGRQKFLQDKIKNKPEMVLPPNVAQPSDKPVVKQDGFFIFAPNAGGGGFNSPSTI